MKGFWLFVVVLLASRTCCAKEYTGEFCAGAVNFPISDGTDESDGDQAAINLYSQFPRWISQSCLTAFWEFSCMLSYGPHSEDGGGYCQDSCLGTLDHCTQTLDLFGEEQANKVRAIVDALCAGSSTENINCHTGGNTTYSDVPDDYGTVCPKPLGEGSHLSGTTIQRIEGTACALPCPPISFTHDEWYLLRGLAKWCCFASFVSSLVVVYFHQEQKNKYIRYLNIGGSVLNAIVFIFLIIDDYEPQTCVDHVHYHERTPLCLIQAVLSVGIYVWIFLWEAVIALNLWISVVLQLKRPQQDAIRAKYMPVCTAIAIVCPFVPLIANNLGYDSTGYTGPICLFLFSQQEGYYWALFFTPVLFIVFVCLVLMIHTMAHASQVLSAKQSNWAPSRFLNRFIKLLKYNRKMFLFAAIFCVVGSFESGLILYGNFFGPSGFEQSAEDYVGCLLSNTIADPQSGIKLCGEHPAVRPDLWRVIVIITYMSSIGILSFFVYGTQGKAVKHLRGSFHSLITVWVSDVEVSKATHNPPSEPSYSSATVPSIGPQSPRARSFGRRKKHVTEVEMVDMRQPQVTISEELDGATASDANDQDVNAEAFSMDDVYEGTTPGFSGLNDSGTGTPTAARDKDLENPYPTPLKVNVQSDLW